MRSYMPELFRVACLSGNLGGVVTLRERREGNDLRFGTTAHISPPHVDNESTRQYKSLTIPPPPPPASSSFFDSLTSSSFLSPFCHVQFIRHCYVLFSLFLFLCGLSTLFSPLIDSSLIVLIPSHSSFTPIPSLPSLYSFPPLLPAFPRSHISP